MNPETKVMLDNKTKKDRTHYTIETLSNHYNPRHNDNKVKESSLATYEDFHKKAKSKIDNDDFSFFLRNKTQQEYHPENVSNFTEKRFEIAYILQDMACLCTSPEVCNFVVEVATKLREGNGEVGEDELHYVLTFISKGKDKYRQSEYVDLTEYDQLTDD